MAKSNKHLISFIATSVGIMVLIAIIVLNFTTIKDFFVGLSYRPSEEMSSIRDSLGLTSKGARIFNAVMPELMEQQNFNATCREQESETAVLGCYKNDRVYIYNITDQELNGIRELTSAHELLHAVYHRLTREEKAALEPLLEQVYQDNQTALGEEIDLYQEDQKKEELYVRAGTEIYNLPTELEKHYAEIFKNQDIIANYYENYISIFKEIEQNLTVLLEKVKAKEAEISTKTARYETDVSALNQEISKFNDCANTPNCFTSNWAFNNSRNALLSRKNTITKAYEEINQLISDYNTLAEEYNQNLLHGQSLNMAINSLSLPE